jgi:AcrR family transcriptional regulator
MTFGDIVARRRKDALTTRAEMLAAARRRFLMESYENVGLRDIARDVGVDVALVSRYFGSKEDLFREVLSHGSEEKFKTDVRPDELADYFTGLFEEETNREQDQVHIDRLIMILRSASSPQAAAIGHDMIHRDVLDPIAAILGGGEDAENRAGMAVLVLLGGLVTKSIMCAHDDCDEPMPDAFRQRLLAVFRAALADDSPDDSLKETTAAVA